MDEHVRPSSFAAVPRDEESHKPRKFRSLLIPVDLSPLSDRVIARVALLPLAEEARLTLLHVVPKSVPARDQRRAEADAKRPYGLFAVATFAWLVRVLATGG